MNVHCTSYTHRVKCYFFRLHFSINSEQKKKREKKMAFFQSRVGAFNIHFAFFSAKNGNIFHVKFMKNVRFIVPFSLLLFLIHPASYFSSCFCTARSEKCFDWQWKMPWHAKGLKEQISLSQQCECLSLVRFCINCTFLLRPAIKIVRLSIFLPKIFVELIKEFIKDKQINDRKNNELIVVVFEWQMPSLSSSLA